MARGNSKPRRGGGGEKRGAGSPKGARRRPQTRRRGRGQSGSDNVDRLYGAHAVAAALANTSRRCHRLFVTEEGKALLTDTLGARATPPGARAVLDAPVQMARNEIGRLLSPGAVHQGIMLEAAPLAAVDLASACRTARRQEGGARPLVVLDQVTDPHNVGAILRSAAAFEVGAVIVQERHAPQTTGALAKAASGALETVPLVRVVNVARALVILKDLGFWCLGLDSAATVSIRDATVDGPLALVLGAEGEGLRRLTRERCDATAAIPIPGAMASLNVSNAAAIALYALTERAQARSR